MKSLNSTDKLWASQSAKDIDTSDYQAACCLNARVNSPAAAAAAPHIRIENADIPVDFLKKVLEKSEHAATKQNHSEDIKSPSK
jgi:hypothetical protein